ADEPGATDCGRLSGAIELDHVTMQYPRGDVALADVSFSVPAGAVAVIRGESGAGKSTLLSLMPRLMDPTGGTIRIDGQDLKSFTIESLRSQIAIVFQESVLFGMSLRENIALGDANATPEEVEAAAERAGVMRFAPELPSGLDTVVGERGARLSGVTDARAMLAGARPFYLRWKPDTSALVGVELRWRTAEGMTTTLASLYMGESLAEAGAKATTLRLVDPPLGPALARLDNAL